MSVDRTSKETKCVDTSELAKTPLSAVKGALDIVRDYLCCKEELKLKFSRDVIPAMNFAYDDTKHTAVHATPGCPKWGSSYCCVRCEGCNDALKVLFENQPVSKSGSTVHMSPGIEIQHRFIVKYGGDEDEDTDYEDTVSLCKQCVVDGIYEGRICYSNASLYSRGVYDRNSIGERTYDLPLLLEEVTGVMHFMRLYFRPPVGCSRKRKREESLRAAARVDLNF